MSPVAAPDTVRYLCTLDMGPDWLTRLRAVSPRIHAEQRPVTDAAEIPREVWAEVDVLHTSSVLPDPAWTPRLRWVQLDTSGVDHVATHPLWAGDVPITTLGGVSPGPLAEYVLFALLGCAHRLPALAAAQTSREWPSAPGRWERYGPAPVAGSTVVVVGYGRIGREIGRRCAAQGMHVLGVSRTGRAVGAGTGAAERYDPFAGDDPCELLVGPDRLREVLARADHVVVVTPLTPQTRGLLDAAALDAIKPGAVFVNVARGGIVDETALLAAVRAGRISAAVLDVFDDEPLPPDSPWWDEPNVFVTPHVGGLAADYAEHVRTLVVENLQRLLDGRPLLNRIDRTAGY